MVKIIIIVHLLIFQSMFFRKNRLLSKKIGRSIRGKNKEAILSVVLFSLTISVSVLSAFSKPLHELFSPISIFSTDYFLSAGILLLLVNLVISFLALRDMRDSWRIGVKEGEITGLVTDGIFGVSRNPYFLSYIIMFIAYILLITNILVIVFSLLSVLSIHKMIIREETHLESLHGERYLTYKKEVPRYFIV